MTISAAFLLYYSEVWPLLFSPQLSSFALTPKRMHRIKGWVLSVSDFIIYSLIYSLICFIIIENIVNVFSEFKDLMVVSTVKHKSSHKRMGFPNNNQSETHLQRKSVFVSSFLLNTRKVIYLWKTVWVVLMHWSVNLRVDSLVQTKTRLL